MDSFKIKYTLLLIAFLSIFGAGIWALFFYVFPAFYTPNIPLILLFFFIIELIFIFVVDSGSKKLSQKALVNLYMSTKVVKILLSLTFAVVCILVFDDNFKNFGLIFLLIYFSTIIFELFYFSKIERRIGMQNKRYISHKDTKGTKFP